GGRPEQCSGLLGPIFRGGDGKGFLALEVMEERALGDSHLLAYLIDRGCGVTLLPDRGNGRVDQLLARTNLGRLLRTRSLHRPRIPTGRYAVNPGHRLPGATVAAAALPAAQSIALAARSRQRGARLQDPRRLLVGHDRNMSE